MDALHEIILDQNQLKTTFDHIQHSASMSIAKAQRLLDYQPRYSSIQAIIEALENYIPLQHTLLLESDPVQQDREQANDDDENIAEPSQE